MLFIFVCLEPVHAATVDAEDSDYKRLQKHAHACIDVAHHDVKVDEFKEFCTFLFLAARIDQVWRARHSGAPYAQHKQDNHIDGLSHCMQSHSLPESKIISKEQLP